MTITPQTNTSFDQLAEFFRTHDDFVICGHVSPDGDCLGSQLCLWHTLVQMGKNATCVLVKGDPIPADLAFLPGIDQMIPAKDFTGEVHTFVGVDVPSRERIGEAACKLLDACETSATIDHHAADVPMCEHVYVDADSASASVLVWQIVKKLVDDPTLESALCAYTGLLTDTGSFRFQNADKAAFACASELVERGVDPSKVAVEVYQNRSFASIQLEKLAIERMEVFGEDKLALSWITAADMAELEASKPDTEPLIDVLRSLRGVRIACMLREQDGAVRGSLRSKDDTDVASLAHELGGGGHRAAAGFTLDATLDEALVLMRAKLLALL